MTKSKLAWLIFFAAFGVNLFAFLFFNKNWIIEENKTVWLYELPLTASPLDAYVSSEMGPAQAVIGTLIKPSHELQLGIATDYRYDAASESFIFNLQPNLKYSDESLITAQDFVHSAAFIQSKIALVQNGLPQEWKIWLKADYQAASSQELRVKVSLGKTMNAEHFVQKIFSNVLTGAIHPKNLEAMKIHSKIDSTTVARAVKELTSHWISSGPYRIRKWRPKEITLASRDDYANGTLGLPKEYFRVLKFQSAPIKNPAADFAQAITTESVISDDHQIFKVPQDLYVFWICRSYQDPSSFCARAENRMALYQNLSGDGYSKNSLLKSGKIRYRIPHGSEKFREDIREKIKTQMSVLGVQPEEVSFLFKNSVDADLELEFVTVPTGSDQAYAQTLGLLSSRLSLQETAPEHLIGLIGVFPETLQIKHEKKTPTEAFFNAYHRVFLEPDPIPEDLKF